jgi:hypothetical protein
VISWCKHTRGWWCGRVSPEWGDSGGCGLALVRAPYGFVLLARVLPSLCVAWCHKIHGRFDDRAAGWLEAWRVSIHPPWRHAKTLQTPLRSALSDSCALA